ncbi:hypothetical protein SLS58_000122 [Diplodia intermedia]|uniref:Uncharacterized protein n=1 Tax=Diplodia intermedia TaxID=856260 RepID=A0ABR3U4U6_9PEZI
MSERPPSLPVPSNTTSASSTPTNSSSSYYSTSATSHSSTPTPTVLELAPTPAPSRNPSLFPGAENSPAGLYGGRGAHLTAAQPGRHFANNADYINALAAAAQASLQSAPSSPGADLPITRSSGKRNSIYGLGGGGGGAAEGGGGAAQEPSLSLLPERLSGLQVNEEREAEKDEKMDEENGERGWRNEEAGGPMDSPPPEQQQQQQQPFGDAVRGSFLDVDSSTPVTTPGDAAGAVDYLHSGLRSEDRSDVAGGPVSSTAARNVDEMEVEDEEGAYEGFTDPFARARAGVSVAKGEGLVSQAGAMMNGQQERAVNGRQQSWSEQDLRHELTARLSKGEPMQGYESTSERQ